MRRHAVTAYGGPAHAARGADPQGFRFTPRFYRRPYAALKPAHRAFTDDAAIAEWARHPGDADQAARRTTSKLTHSERFPRSERPSGLLGQADFQHVDHCRARHRAFDFHPFRSSATMCGLAAPAIPHEQKSPMAYSDAGRGAHALTDDASYTARTKKAISTHVLPARQRPVQWERRRRSYLPRACGQAGGWSVRAGVAESSTSGYHLRPRVPRRSRRTARYEGDHRRDACGISSRPGGDQGNQRPSSWALPDAAKGLSRWQPRPPNCREKTDVPHLHHRPAERGEPHAASPATR